MDNIQAGGEQCVCCREVVHSSECPLSEVPPYVHAKRQLFPHCYSTKTPKLIPLPSPPRLHYALQGYHELLQFIHQMSISRDEGLRENSKVMLSNLVYHQEYRDVFVSLLRNYNEVVQVCCNF